MTSRALHTDDPPFVVGITGTIGAGKGETSRYLAERYGFVPLFVRSVVREELERRGLPVDRDRMRELANQIRSERGADWFVRELIRKAQNEHLPQVIIDSIRVPAEAEAVRDAGGIIIAVDADRKIRYKRVVERASETDRVSYEDFVRQEEAEMTGDGGVASQNLSAVVEGADVFFENNGALEELHQKIDALMAQLRVSPHEA